MQASVEADHWDERRARWLAGCLKDGGDVRLVGQGGTTNHGGAPLVGLEGKEDPIDSFIDELSIARAHAGLLVPEYLAIAGGLVGQGVERYVGRDCHEAEYTDHNFGLGGIAGDMLP